MYLALFLAPWMIGYALSTIFNEPSGASSDDVRDGA